MTISNKRKIILSIAIIVFIFISASIKKKKKPKDKNAIIFSNMKSFEVSDFFTKMDDKSAKDIQKAVDKGKAIITFNKLDNNDGKLSYIAGHNPGIMSQFAKFVKDDREICIHDSKGNKRYYILKFFAKQPKKQRIACDEVNELIAKKDKIEDVLFKFCVKNEIHYWLATPKDEK